MCLITYCPKGSDKNSDKLLEILTKAADFNKDGMGFAIKKANSNKVYISKGYFDLKSVLHQLETHEITKEDELVIHMRIGNKGAIDQDMCHPFVISKSHEEIIANDLEVDKPIVFHNGTMIRHSVTNSNCSDTYFFTRDILANEHLMNFLLEDPLYFEEVFKDHLCKSRLTIMFPDDKETILLGTWHTIDGISFSKNVYSEYYPKPASNVIYRAKNNIHNDTYQDWSEYYRERYGYDDLPWENEEDDNKLKIRLPVNNINRDGFQNSNGINYKLFMGLYIPEMYDVDDDDIIIEINKFTYDKLYLTAKKSDYEYGYTGNERYVINNIEDSLCKLTNVFSEESISIPMYLVYLDFFVETKSNSITFFKDYFDLVRTINISKSQYKKIGKIVDRAIENSLDYINVRGLEEIDTDALTYFYIKMHSELKPYNTEDYEEIKEQINLN